MADIRYPEITGARGAGYWLLPKNLAATRQKIFRVDYSNKWRYDFGDPFPPDRSVPLASLIDSSENKKNDFRIIILGDTGEGDRSQYGLLPLLHTIKPDFIIINGDVVYPAGRIGGDRDQDDFLLGFFKPYSNFNCPIWATPGNHEYYSPNNGREFHDVFCTRKFDHLWSLHGLRHNGVQPGMYWELNDSERESKLVIIGLDTGKSANLDGHNDWWQFWKKKIYPDHTQHIWLDDRLRRAQNRGCNVILLFHIPALARDKRVEKHLSTLHKIIAEYDCVKLVLCGHDHNHQQYTPQAFRIYLEREEKAETNNKNFPSYIINGGGGASLHSTDYKIGPYKGFRYPSKDQWKTYANFGRQIVASLGRDKNVISRIAGKISKAALSDADVAQFLSFMLVEYKSVWGDGSQKEIRITPVFLDNLNSLYDSHEVVDVLDKTHLIKDSKIRSCMQKKLEIVINN